MSDIDQTREARLTELRATHPGLEITKLPNEMNEDELRAYTRAVQASRLRQQREAVAPLTSPAKHPRDMTADEFSTYERLRREHARARHG
jgi:hypothetical protein